MGYSLLPKKTARRGGSLPARASRGMGDLLTYGRDTSRFTRGVGAIAAADAVRTPKRQRQLAAQARADIRRDHALSQITLNGITTYRNESSGGGSGPSSSSGGTTSWAGAHGMPKPPASGVRPGTVTPAWQKYPGVPTPAGAARPIGPARIPSILTKPLGKLGRVVIGTAPSRTKLPSSFPILRTPSAPITDYKPRPAQRPPGGGVGGGVPSSGGGGGGYSPPIAQLPPATPGELEEFEELDVPVDLPAAPAESQTAAAAAATAGKPISGRGMLAIAAAGIGLFFLFR